MLGRRLVPASSSTRLQLAAGWSALQQAGSNCSSGYSSAAAAAATPPAASEPTTPEQLRQAFSYCVSQVKKHDYENYLWVTQLPKVGAGSPPVSLPVNPRQWCSLAAPATPPIHPPRCRRLRLSPHHLPARRRSCARPSLRCVPSTLRQGWWGIMPSRRCWC